ncbi:chemotaxis protein methyltransferase CheR [Clostridium saccharoperbutylacetonicum]|jgi:chemotaxis protein methyltransferase CheR|uniref:protein-glutamate O-methyltransferase n=1 Tax=Clostridium saccharoperbutylacetonicum N1-4(HMT) TaxID=931276 RepID=M1MQ78_9CLOT|nr:MULTISPECIES: protein-glutamate O-methyltransferase CheR [Clostridium]AGF58343.1 chemotaxis protein methyltransferase CheR [Clostridium saccharoperbutylacetonicum N1-4(HMT)]NRT60879.1 chemotaxis protein methyltransferase CheR [Clostridium saccharoperbutylacetonicum]NSB24193.1 chemotaxis protein methyltransferase CheR [Clostridium saccharoperbutylacetonicum]NSB43571.1 chemotaxis protein methyltransferase CheR [Clostridium saccharoperbutylacetonicum]
MDFNEFHKWVHRELGINLSAYKPEQLNRRINSLMTRVGIKSLDEYTRAIKENPEQRQKFLDFITINVTEFFRNPELFQDLEKQISKELLPNNPNLKIWSAACSIGCEPYTLGIILDRLTPNGRHNIIATDIDDTILSKAKIGEYTQNEIKGVNNTDLSKYFSTKDDKYYIMPKIKNMVTFKKHDLILDNYENGFDLIVCRNVVIYFNNDIKQEIYKKFSNSLKKGGLLFVGATESIYNYRDYGFEKASTFIYKKL